MSEINSQIISIFVDNIKVISMKQLDYIHKMKEKLTRAVKMINMYLISFYIRLKVKKN